jgi:hypothetical protein
MHPERVKDRRVELSDEIRLADRGWELGDLERNWRALVALCGEPIDE